MAEPEIRVEGLDELQAYFKRINGKVRPTLTKTMDKAVKYVHSTVPSYPPKPPTSTYTRTNLLGKGISTEVKSLGAEIVGIIGADRVYAPYVISEDDQAWMHEGRWWTLQKVVRKARGSVQKFFKIAIKNLLRFY